MAKVTLAERIMTILATDGPQFTRQLAATLEAKNDSISEVCSCLRKKGGCGSCDSCCSACRKHCSKP